MWRRCGHSVESIFDGRGEEVRQQCGLGNGVVAALSDQRFQARRGDTDELYACDGVLGCSKEMCGDLGSLTWHEEVSHQRVFCKRTKSAAFHSYPRPHPHPHLHIHPHPSPPRGLTITTGDILNITLGYSTWPRHLTHLTASCFLRKMSPPNYEVF